MRILTVSLLACAFPALAHTTLPSVEVTASRDRARLLDTAAVTVIGREELVKRVEATLTRLRVPDGALPHQC